MAEPYAFLDELDLNPDVKFRLSQSLRRVEEGNSDEYLTPTAERYSPHELLAAWDNVYESHRHKLDVELDDLEQSNRAKIGPRSLAKPWVERRESVENYFKPETLEQGPKIVLPTPQDLRMLSVETASKFLKSSTSSGLPDLKDKGVILERLVRDIEEYIDRDDPAVLFTRTQEFIPDSNPPRSKTRPVWGYPAGLTLLEMMVYRVLLEHAKKLPFRAALLGPTAVDKAVSRLFGSAIMNGMSLVSIDFNAYDASVKRVLQNSVREYVLNLFQKTGSVGSVINYIFDKINTIGIVTPDGVMLGEHGIPSGSTFTNEADSLAQYLVAQELKLISQVQGDDGLYATHDPEELFTRFKSFNLDVNEGKSYTSTKFAVYLQRYYSLSYMVDNELVGVMPSYRMLNRWMYPERFTDFESYGMRGQDYFNIRTITLCENMKFHPLFEDMVKFVYKYDKYNLQFSEKGLKQYVKMLSETSGSQGLIVNQFGDEITGLRNFATVKLIKTF